MTTDELYMHRCLELAMQGAGYVAPNPMVGAVIVNNERIIGEGYHQHYGNAHAEVICIESVSEEDKHLISSSTLYVSLEPCAHFGKTPPCADLIIKHKIPKVVIGCIDRFAEVDGRGVKKLIDAGIEVITGVLEKECIDSNKRFFTYHSKKRPYIILKWAQSLNQKIANADRLRVLISNEYTNRLVHKWRSEEAAIMVGTNTALIDDPSLNTRLWNGKDPVRLILDLNLRLPDTLSIFNKQQPTIILNKINDGEEQNLKFIKINSDENVIQQIMEKCYELNIQSMFVEGGTQLLESFINEGIWDEARVIQNDKLIIPEGIAAPELMNRELVNVETISTDKIYFYKNAVL